MAQSIAILAPLGRDAQVTASIREYRIDGGGLRVGEPLRQFSGVLTGVPTYQGDSGGLLAERQRR